MRFVADENIEGPIVRQLSFEGHDVLWILKERPRASDEAVLLIARSEARILLTNDKDFAELTYLRKLSSTGIVLLRMGALRTSDKVAVLQAAIQQFGDGLTGWFTVLTPHGVRRRPLDSGSEHPASIL